ncbi:MAG TPA: translocation/assembly module TamB domain-containing protein [Burkholderiales bacterium]|nr:translocation/assembly module TamB domain-containing protein [Burkholderiales bacterium]
MRRLALLALLLLAALTALVLWSRTEHALSTVVGALERASNGRLEVRGASGTLYGPLRIQRLVAREAGSEVVVEALALEWSPAVLLAATLKVDRLVAESVTLRLAGDDASAAVPAALRVPLRVALNDVRVERIAILREDATLELKPLAASLTLGLTRHTLALREFGTPWARVEGELSLGAWAPFPLEGRVGLRALQRLPVDSVDATVSGRLARISLQLAPKADWLAGHVAAVVAPFEDAPLRGLSAALKEVNLAGLNPLLPSTRVALDARLFANGAQLAGPVSLTNALAGPLDTGRIPLSAARGQARVDGLRLHLDALQMAFADAGGASGRLALGPQGYTAELASDGLRLDRLHGALRPLRPAGSVRLSGNEGGEQFEAKLTEGDTALDLRLQRNGERVNIESATLRTPGGEVAATGMLRLNEAREFALDARLANFDPSAFVEMPPAQLSGTLRASGALQPEWHAQIDYRIADGRFAEAPLRGQGRLSVTQHRVSLQGVSLALGVNRLRADGRFGAPGDRLKFELDAAQLAQFGPLARGTTGALRAQGWIGETAAKPAFGIEAEARELRIAGRSLGRLEAKLEGTVQQHALSATLEDTALAATLRAQGGLSEAGGWKGRLEALEAARPYRAQLLAPVALHWRPDRLETGAGRLRLAGGELSFEALVVAKGTLQTRGRVERIAVADLLAAPHAPATVRTDLVVSGAWELRAADVLSGSLQLVRDSGDVVMAGDTPLPLEISELRLDAVARANTIEATLRGQGAKLGALSVDLRTTAERTSGAWQIAPQAPLSLRARFTVPSLNWLGRLLNPELRTRGRLSGQVDVDGTLEAPRLQGALNGEQLQLRYGAAGLRLRDGEMTVELAQDKVFFRRIAFRGDEGRLTASGEATLAGGRAQLDLEFEADKLAAVRRDDHQLALSGRGRVRSRDGWLALEGEFTADRGLIELRDADRPSLSSDVVIVSAEPKLESSPARLRVDVKLNLGEAFYVKGEGLDVRMEGGVRVTLDEGEIRPRARGEVRVAEGHYRAYGQQLEIARGVLLFDGPLDNPKLDILAVRRNQRVVAGVLIGGSALSPRTSLYSNPPVPDAQKLQYLVFGAGPGSAGDAEFGLASTSTHTRRDEFVSVGAQLASAVYVSVGQSLRNADSFVQATLDLTERIALQGRTGAENAVTLIYSWEFD